MMLDWLGQRHQHAGLIAAARRVERAVADVLGEGKTLPVDQGGSATTREVGEAVALRVPLAG